MSNSSMGYPKVTAELLSLVPEQYRNKCGMNWNEKNQRFYVFLRGGYRYDPDRKRSIDIREPLGSIQNQKFTYSPSFLKKQKIEQLQDQVTNLSSKVLGVGEKQLEAAQKLAQTMEDPRQEAKVQFPLPVVLAVSLLSSMAGQSSAVSIATYWRKFHDVLSQLFDNFPEADISHDTINRIFRLIKKECMTELLSKLAGELITQAEHRVIGIDGQAVKASKTDKLDNGRYIFNAYDATNGLVLTHLLIDEKGNEITHCEDLVRALDLKPGDIITADAMNTQTKLVDALPEGVLYCLAVKENQPNLSSEIRHLFAVTDESRFREYASVDAGHGRIENRRYRVLPSSLLSPGFKRRWKGLNQGCLVEVTDVSEAKSQRARNSSFTRYFISSSPYDRPGCPQFMGSIVRKHWSIENNLHWQLDVSFTQDRIQCSDSNYLLNRVALNKIALNSLKRVQKILKEKHGEQVAINTLQFMCSDPVNALNAIIMAEALKPETADVKA